MMRGSRDYRGGRPGGGRPLGSDLEDRAIAESSAGECGAIEIARRIEDHARVRAQAVGSAAEVVQNGLIAGRVNLEHGSVAECAAGIGGAVEIAVSVMD